MPDLWLINPICISSMIPRPNNLCDLGHLDDLPSIFDGLLMTLCCVVLISCDFVKNNTKILAFVIGIRPFKASQLLRLSNFKPKLPFHPNRTPEL